MHPSDTTRTLLPQQQKQPVPPSQARAYPMICPQGSFQKSSFSFLLLHSRSAAADFPQAPPVLQNCQFPGQGSPFGDLRDKGMDRAMQSTQILEQSMGRGCFLK